MRQTPSSEITWSQRAKALAIFGLTTATYLIARATGWMPKWFTGKNENHSMQLFSQQNPVSIVNPISDQTITIQHQNYLNSLDDVFSPGYNLLGAVETGKNQLPNWLNLEYRLVGTYPSPWESISQVAVLGNIVVIAQTSSVQILNITDPTSPQLISTYSPINANINNIAAVNSTVFFVDRALGLNIMNISNLSTPRLIGSYSGVNTFTGIVVSEPTVFIVDAFTGLKIFDVSNLALPRLISTCPVMSGGYALDIMVFNRTAYIAGGSAGVQIIDVSNMASPKQIGAYTISTGSVEWLALSGAKLFAVGSNLGLLIIDVSYPTKPVLLSSIYSFGLNSSQGVTAIGNIVFVGTQFPGLQVIDVSNMLQPRLLGISIGYAYRTVYYNGLAFLNRDLRGLQIINFSQGDLMGAPSLHELGDTLSISVEAHDFTQTLNTDTFIITVDQPPVIIQNSLSVQSVFPGDTLALQIKSDLLFTNPGNTFLQLSLSRTKTASAPSWIQLLSTPIQLSSSFVGIGQASDVLVSDETAFVLIYGNGLQIMDLSNPNNPNLLSSYHMAGALQAALSGKTIFIANINVGLSILNIGNWSKPQLLSTYTSSVTSSYDVAVSGGAAFVVDFVNGLQIINISNLVNPTFISAYPIAASERANALEIVGNYVFLACNSNLKIIDISRLKTPKLVTVYGMNNVVSIAVSGNLLFLENNLMDLNIIDISNISKPQLLNNYSNSGIGPGLVVIRKTVFIAQAPANLQILDFSNVSNPVFLGSYAIGDFFGAFALLGNHGLVAANLLGLQIIDLSQWRFTASPGKADVGNHPLRLTAMTNLGGKSFINFILRVEGPPQLNGSIPLQRAWVGQLFNYFVSPSLFSDPNKDVIDYTVRLLPRWLQFNPLTIDFSGVPSAADVGELTITLSATDRICLQTPSANLTIRINFLPVLSHRIPDQLAPIGLPYVFVIPENTFFDPSGSSLNYSVSSIDNPWLPNWLSFNATSRILSGVANTSNISVYTLKLTAINSAGGEAITSFILRTDHFPAFHTNQLGLPVVAIVNQPFIWILPSNAFTDADGDPLDYAAAQEDGGALPSWLSFNPMTRTFTGAPLSPGVQAIKITVQDAYGGSNSTYFNITILSSTPGGSINNTTQAPIPNNPPQVYLPISNQVAQVNQPFVFFASRRTFSDTNGDNLTYTVNVLPSWLRFDPEQLKFWGTPGRGDTDPLTARIINVELMARKARDGSNQASTLFTISVHGTSNLLMFLQVAIPLLSGLGTLWKLYQKQAFFLNRCCKKRIKREIDMTIGKMFETKLETPPEKVGEISMRYPKPEEKISRGNCWAGLFQEAPGHFSTKYLLPHWLSYSKNKLVSKEGVPSLNHNRFTLYVSNQKGVILEELNVTVKQQHSAIP